MKLLVSLLLSLLVLSQSKKITRKTFPNNFIQLAQNFNEIPTTSDCGKIQSFDKEFDKCEKLIEGKPSEKYERLVSLIISSFNLKETSKILINMNGFCKAALETTKCINALDNVCKNESNYPKVDQYIRFQKLSNPAYGAIDGKMCDSNGIFMKALSDKVQNKKFTDCLKDDKALKKVEDAVDRFIKFMRKFKDSFDKSAPSYIDYRTTPSGKLTPPPPPNSKNEKNSKKLVALCNQRNNFIKFLGTYTSDCDDDFRMFLMELSSFIVPKSVAKYCKKPKTDGKMKLNRLEKTRLSMFMFGGMNFYRNNTIETCTGSDGDEMILIDTTKVVLKCTVKAINNYYVVLTSCSLVFEDLDEIDLTGTKVPNGFKNSKGKELKGKGEGKGKNGSPDFDISIKRVSDKKIIVTDKNSGIIFAIRIFISSKNVKVLSINLRVPKSLLDVGTGSFTVPCGEVVNKDNPNGLIDGENVLDNNQVNSRFKRAPNTADITKAGSYDATNLDDENAKNMATNALVDLEDLIGLDNVITGSTGSVSKMNLFSLVAVFLATLERFLLE